MEELTREQKIAWVKAARQLHETRRYYGYGACEVLSKSYPSIPTSPQYCPYRNKRHVKEILSPYKPKGVSYDDFWWDRNNWKVRRDVFDCILAGLEGKYLKYFYLKAKIAWCYKANRYSWNS